MQDIIIDVHSNIKWSYSISYLKTRIFFTKPGTVIILVFVPNIGASALNVTVAKMYVYMSSSYTTKTSVIACLVFSKIAV